MQGTCNSDAAFRLASSGLRPQYKHIDFILNALEERVGKIPNSKLAGLKEQYGGVKTQALLIYVEFR